MLNELSSYGVAREKIGRWIDVDYNILYVHSSIRSLSPENLEELYRNQVSFKETT